jgi:hypothetical protein
MFNKKFFVVMAVLLSASLFLIGCPTDASDGAAGATGNEGGQGPIGPDGPAAPQILGGTYTAPGLNVHLGKLSKDVKLTVDDLTITGTGPVDFRELDVTIAGTVDVSTATGPVYLVFAKAAVEVASGGFTLGSNTVIGSSEQKAAWGAEVSGSFIESVADPAEASPGNVAVAKYTLGAADAIPENVVVTVYEELTVDGSSAVPENSGARVVAIGKVALTASNDKALVSPSKVDIANAEVVYAGTETIKVKLPGVVSGTQFNITSGKVEVDGPSTVTAAVRGSGELAFVGTTAYLTATITGSGRLSFNHETSTGTITGAPVTLAGGSSITASDIAFKQGAIVLSGTVTLDGTVGVASEKAITYTAAGSLVLAAGSSLNRSVGNVSETLLKTHGAALTLTGAASTALTVEEIGLDVSAGAIVFDGPVDFEDNLELTAIGATFKGATTFANGKGLVLTAATSTVTLPGTATSANAWLGVPYTDASSAAWSTVLSNSDASNALVLTPAVNTKLVFDGRTVTQSSSGTSAGAHGITIGGKAVLGAGATYTVAAGDGVAVGTLDVTTASSHELVLSAGNELLVPPASTPKAKLVLGNGAKLTGAGSVVAGKTVIVGNAGWTVSTEAQAPAGSVTIERDKITVSGVTTKLAGASGTAPTITTTAEADAKAQLDLIGTIDVNTAGSIVLTGADTTYSAVLHLIEGVNPGKVVIDSSKNTAVTTVGTASNKLTVSSGTAGGTDIYISKTAPAVGALTGTPASATEVLLQGGAATITTTTEAGSISAGGTDAYLISPQESSYSGTIVKTNKFLGSNPL